MIKLIKKIFRFLWPEKKKWGEYRKDVTEVTALVEKIWKQQTKTAMKNAAKSARMAELNAPDPSLPVVCTACGRPTQASKVDDRLVACIACKMVYMTDEARDDPNVMRDLTHANAGISPRMTTTKPCSKWEQMVRGWWEQSDKSMLWEDYWADLKSHGPNLKEMYGQAIDLTRDREIREAGAFGEGYTRGKYNMSREEFNKQKREKLEEQNEI